MGRHKHSIEASTLEAIEQVISTLPNGSVVKKLTILSSFTWLRTEEIAKAYRINPRTLFRWINQFRLKFDSTIFYNTDRQGVTT